MSRMSGVRAEVVTNSLVASAQRVSGRSRNLFRRKDAWQSEAWKMFHLCGELRYSANWVGNVVSRATLHSARREVGGAVVPNPGGKGEQFLGEAFGGIDGQPQMLKSIGVHLFVAGECYLVGRAPRPERDERPGADIWEIISVEEMQQAGTEWQINYDDGLPPLTLTKDDVVIRIWVPDPVHKMRADSPVRAQLANLRELLLLSRHVSAQATSRLAGNGILFLSSGMTFPVPPDMPEGSSSADAFSYVLGEAMLEPIEDPTSPSAIVPTVVTGPGDEIDKAKHLTFWSPFDEQAPNLRNEAIRRLALGLDIPPEIMLGTADMNHWGAWQVEESSIKIVIEPMLEWIVIALTLGAELEGDDVIAYDTAKLRMRPNRSKEAMEMYDRLELSGESTRRETGFDESDAPSLEELRMRLLLKLADGSSNPEQVAAAYKILGIADVPGDAGPIREARPDPSLEDHPTRELPERSDMASVNDMSAVIVFRAMERAGNRLRSLKQMRPDCAAWQTYLFVKTEPGELDKVLEDAWGIIPEVMPNIRPEQRQVIIHALDTYCRHLLLSQQQYDRSEMERYLTSLPVRNLV